MKRARREHSRQREQHFQRLGVNQGEPSDKRPEGGRGWMGEEVLGCGEVVCRFCLFCFLFNLNRNRKAQNVSEQETDWIRVLERTFGLPVWILAWGSNLCPNEKIHFTSGPGVHSFHRTVCVLGMIGSLTPCPLMFFIPFYFNFINIVVLTP